MSTLKKIIEILNRPIGGEKKFESLYNTGIDFYGKQEYEKAIKHFKLATEHKKAQPQAYYNLALSYQNLKDYDRAAVTYAKFLELNPKDYDGLYNLALIYYNKENFIKAAEYFERCLEIKKEEDGVKAVAMTYLAQNEEQKALDLANDLLENQPNGLKLYTAIAKVFENKNSLNKDFTLIDIAIDMYKKITEKDPNNFDAYLAMSICYAKKGDWEDSVNFCKQAIATNPKSYEANNQMGLVYYCSNKVKEAVSYYEAALGLKPEGDYKIYSNLGYAYEKIGEIDKAVKIFTKLVSKFPQYPAKDEIKNHIRVLKSL